MQTKYLSNIIFRFRIKIYNYNFWICEKENFIALNIRIQMNSVKKEAEDTKGTFKSKNPQAKSFNSMANGNKKNDK